jgi:predicted alpha/beta-hydrolase family hydrolase
VTVTATHEVETSIGTARVHLSGTGPALLALGHGAGGGVGALDLVAAAEAAHSLGWRVALVEQPWRVKGRKVAEAPPRLDRAWVEVLATLSGQPLVVGGRSAGARVACRTATEVGAQGVLCLAFPLHPPGRPDRSRLPELAAVELPALVVQGDADAFGLPPRAVVVPGADHGFRVRRGLPPAGPQITAAVRAWLQTLT